MRRKLDNCTLFFKQFSKTKESSSQSYRIDKICSHFTGVLQAGQKGTDSKDFPPTMSKVHFFLKKRNSKTNKTIVEISSSTVKVTKLSS